MEEVINNSLENRLREMLNCANREGASNTPDFILSQYMIRCLEAFESAVKQREIWHGRDVQTCYKQG